MHQDGPRPPKNYQRFTQRFPRLGEAWEVLNEAASDGPLDARELRLCKLAIALGHLREGAVHANVRKALAEGITVDEIEQVVAACASTLGLPATAAVFSWVHDVIDSR